MENTPQNGYSNPRMDRLENIMEMLVADHVKFADEHNKLLTSQVLLTGSLQQLSADIVKLHEAQKATDEQMKATDGRLSILAGMMDTFIRERGNRQ